MRGVLVLMFAAAMSLTGVTASHAVESPPAVGNCYDYSVDQGIRGAATPQVDCATNHSAETYVVGTLGQGFPRPDRATRRDLGRESARYCTTERMNAYLGITENFPTRFRSFVHVPSVEQWQAGQRWVRCDLALRDGLTLEKWRGSATALVAESAPALFHYCTPSVGFLDWPDPVRTRAQRCTAPKKQWILVSTPTLGTPTARYRGQRATARKAQAQCKGFRNVYPGDLPPPERSWYFNYPTATGWESGQRQALCWVPLQQYNDTMRIRQEESVDDGPPGADAPS